MTTTGTNPSIPHSRAAVTWQLLVKELSAFGVVGGLCFLLDIGLFQLLYAHAGVGAVTARLISSLVSVTVGYFAHRHVSFAHRARTDPKREFVLFAVINGATMLLSLAVVWVVRYPLGQESALVLQVANIASIGLATILRYLAYRRWVFVAHDHPAAVEVAPSRQKALDAAA